MFTIILIMGGGSSVQQEGEICPNQVTSDDFIWSYSIGAGTFSTVCCVNHIGKLIKNK